MGHPWLSVTALYRNHAPLVQLFLFAANTVYQAVIGLPRPPLQPQTRGCSVRFEVCCVNHGCLVIGSLSSQASHDPSEYAQIAPPFPSVVQGLWRTILARRIGPPQFIAIYEDNSTQYTSIVSLWVAMVSWKIRFRAYHLLVGQTEYIFHQTRPESRGLETCEPNTGSHNNGFRAQLIQRCLPAKLQNAV